MAVKTYEETMASRWDHLKAKRKTLTAPRRPQVVSPEHPATLQGCCALPRGARAVAKAAAEPWVLSWFHAITEPLEKPKRGGDSYGVRFEDPETGRYGWATWVEGSFSGPAVLYRHRATLVPRLLNAKELKEVLADG